MCGPTEWVLLGRQHQRIAVRRALGDEVGADRAAGAGLVLDHHDLSQLAAQLLRDHSRKHVGRAAGGKRHHQLHRTVGPRLGVRERGKEGERDGENDSHGRSAARKASEGWPMVASAKRVTMPREISALVFDAYGTLFDVHSVTRVAESLFPGKGAALSAAWRTKQLEYTWLRSLMGSYEDFSRVTAASLEWTFEFLQLEPGEAARRALIDEYRRLAMFPGSAGDPREARREVPARHPLQRASRDARGGRGPQRAARALPRRHHQRALRANLQARAGGLRAGRGQARPAAHHDGLRVVERLGRRRRQVLRLPRLLGEPGGRAGGAPGGASRRDRARTSPGSRT